MIFKYLDSNSDGQIEYTEFCKILMDKTVPLFNRATNRSVSPTNRSSAPNEDFVSKALLAYKL